MEIVLSIAARQYKYYYKHGATNTKCTQAVKGKESKEFNGDCLTGGTSSYNQPEYVASR